MNLTADSQRGGILTFVLIGTVLTLLLVGGIYMSKNQGRQAAVGQTNTTTDQPAPPANSGDDKDSQDQPERGGSSATPNPGTSPGQTSSPQNNPPQQSGIASTGPSQIASTGPGDVIFSALALAAITAGLGVYFRSASRIRLAALK